MWPSRSACRQEQLICDLIYNIQERHRNPRGTNKEQMVVMEQNVEEVSTRVYSFPEPIDVY